MAFTTDNLGEFLYAHVVWNIKLLRVYMRDEDLWHRRWQMTENKENFM